MKSSCIDEIIFEIKNLCYLDATKFVAQCFIFKKIFSMRKNFKKSRKRNRNKKLR